MIRAASLPSPGPGGGAEPSPGPRSSPSLPGGGSRPGPPSPSSRAPGSGSRRRPDKLILGMTAVLAVSVAGVAVETLEQLGVAVETEPNPSHVAYLAALAAMAGIAAITVGYTRRLRAEAARQQEMEAVARESARRIEGLVNSLDGIVWEADPRTFQVFFVSPQFERLLGYPAADWLSGRLTWKDLIHPGDYDRVIETCAREIAAVRNHTLEYRMVAADGRVVWFRDVTTVVEAGGRPTKLLGILVDITERRRAEEALTLFRSLVDRTNDAIEVIDAGTGRFLDMNEKACLAHGFTRGEYLALTVPDVDPRVAERPWEEVREEVRRGGSIVFESIHRRKDGSVFPVEVNCTHVRLDRDYMIAVVRDITERKKAEEALHDSEEKFRLLTEKIPEIFFILEPETDRALYTSPAFEKIFGRGLEFANRSAWSWLEAVHPDDAPSLRGKIAAGLATAKDGPPGGSQDEENEFRILRPDGSVRWVRARAFRAPGGPGTPLRIIGLVADVTEQKRLQERLRQTQKLEAVGQLAGGVAHELNNPLQAIIAYSSILERKAAAMPEGPEVEQCRKTVSALRGAAERSAKIVKGLLSFARKDGVTMTTVDLNDLARSTAEFLSHTLGLQEVRVELHLAPGPLPVRGNPVALQQVLTNLLINAKDAMPGGGTVALRTRPENGSAEIAVADAGTGMTPEAKARLFEPFFTTKAPGKGTGLGLSIAYGIVKEHGGSIEVESAPGKGSTFILRFPAAGGSRVPEAAASGAIPTSGGAA